jgi:hypothetical protein
MKRQDCNNQFGDSVQGRRELVVCNFVNGFQFITKKRLDWISKCALIANCPEFNWLENSLKIRNL